MADQSKLMTMLQPVLERMGADGAKVARMIKHEMETEFIIEFCNAQVGVEILKWKEILANGNEQLRKASVPIYRDWKLGDNNPLRGDAVVWAMLHAGNHVIVYSLRRISLEGRIGFQFFKDVVFKPLQVSGQISHRALVGELERFMNEGAAVAADPKTAPAAGDDEDEDADDGEREEATEATTPTNAE